MNIPNENDAGNCDDTALQSQETSPEIDRDKPQTVKPEEFFQLVAIDMPEATQAIVTAGRGDVPNDHRWCKRTSDRARWLAEKSSGRIPAYFSMAAFDAHKVFQYGGRAKCNVLFIKSFWIDIEGSADKYERNPGGGYRDEKAALAAVADFLRATGLKPNALVKTGSGGLHLHFVLGVPIAPDVWIGRARALVALAQKHGFKIDAQCSTDAARIMRAPGSLHQKTGKLVQAYRWRVKPYTLEEFDSLVGYSHDTANPLQLQNPTPGKYDLSANENALVDYPKYSYVQAAQKCGAMHKAALGNGADTPYPVWILALKTAALSIEGLDYAHEISCGHPDYDHEATDRKIDSLEGGPAGCKAWVDAYGTGGPCDTCEHGEY